MGEIFFALQKIFSLEFIEKLKHTETPYGEGHSTELIIQKLKLIID